MKPTPTGNKAEFKALQHIFMLITGRSSSWGNSLMNGNSKRLKAAFKGGEKDEVGRDI